MRLRPWLLLVFVALVVPVFSAVLAFNYLTAERVARQTANELVERSLHDAGARTRELIDPIRTMVQAAAGLASVQATFLRSAEGLAYLGSVLTHGESVTGVFAGFSDGAFRGVFRAGSGDVIQGVVAPERSFQARVMVDPDASRVLEFTDRQGRLLESHVMRSEFDPRTRPWFASAMTAGGLHLSDPYVFASSGVTGLTVAAPFGSTGSLAGVVGADITVATISKHMADWRISANAESLLLDERSRVLAHARAGSASGAGSALPNLVAFGGDRMVTALARGRQSPGQVFHIEEEVTGAVTAVLSVPLGDTLGKPWELLAMAPLSDFSGALHDNNRLILMLGLAALVLQSVIIVWLSGKMASPLERLSERIKRIRSFQGDKGSIERSRLHEVDSLGQAITTLQAAVNSFSAYVPRALVRQLVDRGQALSLGGQSRYLSLMFTDLVDFSALSERTPAHTLLRQVSAYHGLVSAVVESELGTVDKFIGDGAMAFWGAPAEVPDHAWHACVAALRIKQGIVDLNRAWESEGLEPLKVRIGIHCDSVLVGNIGSVERMSYTVLGDGVNVAAYMEAANKAFGTAICISHAVVREAGHRLCTRPLDQVSVKTRQSAILVHELLGVNDAQPELAPVPDDVSLARLTAQAWKLSSEGHTAAAHEAYGRVLVLRPQDPVAQRMLQTLSAL
jgi:adenylate cyclase